jgi:hypothetical protein
MPICWQHPINWNSELTRDPHLDGKAACPTKEQSMSSRKIKQIAIYGKAWPGASFRSSDCIAA